MKHHETLEHALFDATISALDAETSALGAAISDLARSFLQYQRGVSGDISDCEVGITPQMCNRVTNHGDIMIWVLFPNLSRWWTRGEGALWANPGGWEPGWKSGESNTEIAEQIYTQFLHINISAQILYKLLCSFIYLLIAVPIDSDTNLHGTNYSRKTTNDCDPLIPL